MDKIPPVSELVRQAIDFVTSTELHPDLHPIPGTKALTLEAILIPPLFYYIALLLLPPATPPAVQSTHLKVFRNTIAAAAAIEFFRLPLSYHVPQSIGLTYQLGLVGIYGACRVIDAFFISPYLFKHIPKRVRYSHIPRSAEKALSEKKANNDEKEWTDGGLKDHFMGVINENGAMKTLNGSAAQTPSPSSKPDSSATSYFPDSLDNISAALNGPEPVPVYETARTEETYPNTLPERVSWALELMLSMRGTGFTWTTADVRHTRKTWLPSVGNRIHSILIHVMPVLVAGWAVIRSVYTTYLAQEPDLYMPKSLAVNGQESFDANLPFHIQLVLTLALGAFLMAAFSLAHSLFAIVCAPFAPSPLAFFPPLYTMRVWRVTSVRRFWSFGWHRLFARVFLVYGVWPGEYVERRLTGKTADQPADIGKVIGAFLSSAFVHSFSVRGVLAGDWYAASGEAKFFTLNGVAIAIEEVVRRSVKQARKSRGWKETAWYDEWVGRIYWISVLLFTGRNFARGWVKSGLIKEMAFV